MKIAYFNGTLKVEDGVTRVILAFVREMHALGHECVIVTGHAEDRSITNAPIFEVPSISIPFYKEYKIPLPGMKGFEKVLNEFKPDIIHVHSPETGSWAALKYARKNNIPIVATHHTDFAGRMRFYHMSFLEPLVWKLLRRLYLKMDILTTPSEVSMLDLHKHKILNAETQMWGVDFENFDKKYRSENWRKSIAENDEKIILHVSRIAWEKELKILTEAYNVLRRNRSDFKMVVVGDGPAKNDLMLLMPGAIFLGHLDGRMLSEVYSSSDILLFPSSTETFGNVTVEAIASGIVPVVANAGGSKSIVSDGENGLLAVPGDVNDFVKKVEILLDDSALYKKLQKNGNNFIKDFSWEKVNKKFVDIYENLIKNK